MTMTERRPERDDGELVLRQKFTALAFYASGTIARDEPMPTGELVMLIHKTLSGEADPRERVSRLHTVEAGHVDSDPETRFQLAIDEHGVKMRRSVVGGKWETNPEPATATEKIVQRFLTADVAARDGKGADE